MLLGEPVFLTAGPASNQTTATQITGYLTIVNAGVSNGSVRLPFGDAPGTVRVVLTSTGLTHILYPAVGETINTAGSQSLLNNLGKLLIKKTATDWHNSTMTGWQPTPRPLALTAWASIQ